MRRITAKLATIVHCVTRCNPLLVGAVANLPSGLLHNNDAFFIVNASNVLSNMPIQSGISHAAAGLLSILLAAYISAHSSMIKDATEHVGDIVVASVSTPLDAELIGLVTIMTVLSFVWGVAYHMSRHS